MTNAANLAKGRGVQERNDAMQTYYSPNLGQVSRATTFEFVERFTGRPIVESALHEAAHAVVAMALGVEVETISIGLPRPCMRPASGVPLDGFVLAAIAAAGLIVDRWSDPEGSHPLFFGPDTDEQSIVRSITHSLFGGVGEVHLVGSELAIKYEGPTPVEQIDPRMVLGDMFNAVGIAASRILRANRAGVDALASAVQPGDAHRRRSPRLRSQPRDVHARATENDRRNRSTQARIMINLNRPDPENPLHALGTIVNWRDPPKPIAWRVVDVFAPGKVSVIVAGPAEGKSPLADWIALSVALGRSVFADRWATTQCPVVYYDSETGTLAEERIARMANVLGVKTAEVPLTFVHGDASFSEEMLVMLEAGVKHTGAGLVIIDTYGATLGGDIDHHTAQFSEWLKRLGKLSRATGATMLVLMHEKKSSDGSIAGIAGHHSAGGAAQSVVTLALDEASGAIEVRCTRHPRKKWEPFWIRWEDVPEPKAEGAGRFAGVSLDGVSWGLRPVLADAPVVKIGRKEERAAAATRRADAIEDALRKQCPRPITIGALRTAVGLSGDNWIEAFALVRRRGNIREDTGRRNAVQVTWTGLMPGEESPTPEPRTRFGRPRLDSLRSGGVPEREPDVEASIEKCAGI